jgi:hypothetical protein
MTLERSFWRRWRRTFCVSEREMECDVNEVMMMMECWRVDCPRDAQK